MRPTPAPKLRALTSLRFIAAAMIVVQHTHGLFGLPPCPGGWRYVCLGQAVSFFFVLSGFILTYVYPNLTTWAEGGRFLLARVARLWPAHAFALVLLFCLLGTAEHTACKRLTPGILLMNLCMVHSWIPSQAVCWGYNGVSWSIATEFAFYICFLFLIPRWGRTWHVKLLGAGLLLTGMAAACNALHVSEPGTAVPGIDRVGMIYVHPLSRLFEFTLGMAFALLWRKWSGGVRPGRALGTAAELAAVGLVLANLYYADGLGAALTEGLPWLGVPGGIWCQRAGACLSFGVLILVMACADGWLSSLLGARLPVLLGEISYSVYLLHWILSQYLTLNMAAFEAVPSWLLCLGYWAVVLLLAHAVWSCVEVPLRAVLLRLCLGARGGGEAAGAARSGRKRAALACECLLLVGAIGAVVYCTSSPERRGLSPPDVKAIAAAGVEAARDVHFGNRFVLHGAVVERGIRGRSLKLVWRSCKGQALDQRLAVHLLDGAGGLIAQADCAQDAHAAVVQEDETWLQTVFLSEGQLQGVHTVGLALFSETEGVLAPDRGPRDAGNRLLLALP